MTIAELIAMISALAPEAKVVIHYDYDGCGIVELGLLSIELEGDDVVMVVE